MSVNPFLIFCTGAENTQKNFIGDRGSCVGDGGEASCLAIVHTKMRNFGKEKERNSAYRIL